MKITKADVMMRKANKKKPKNKPKAPVDWTNFDWRPVVCRVYTDEGICGDGEVAVADGAAALHMEAVIPNFVIDEHHVFDLLQYKKDFCVYDYQQLNGMNEIPNVSASEKNFRNMH